MQVDATKIEAFVLQIHVMWDGLFQIAGYMTILGTLLGWTCLVGLFVIMTSIPIMGKITGKMFGMNRLMVKYTDERVKTVNEGEPNQFVSSRTTIIFFRLRIFLPVNQPYKGFCA